MSAAASSTTTSGQRSGCWSRSSAATPSSAWRGSTSRWTSAATVDDVINVLLAGLKDVIENDPGFFLLLFELFSAGRRNPDIQVEFGSLFERTRTHVAEILKAKEREGVLNLRYDAEAVVSYLFAVGDGFALQTLSDPERDHDATLAAATAAARYLLVGD